MLLAILLQSSANSSPFTEANAAWFGAVVSLLALALAVNGHVSQRFEKSAEREADKVLREAVELWPEHVLKHFTDAVAEHGQPRMSLTAAVIALTSEGVTVPRSKPGKEDVATLVARRDCVNHAYAQHDGYRVILRFDKDDFSIVRQ